MGNRALPQTTHLFPVKICYKSLPDLHNGFWSCLLMKKIHVILHITGEIAARN